MAASHACVWFDYIWVWPTYPGNMFDTSSPQGSMSISRAKSTESPNHPQTRVDAMSRDACRPARIAARFKTRWTVSASAMATGPATGTPWPPQARYHARPCPDTSSTPLADLVPVLPKVKVFWLTWFTPLFGGSRRSKVVHGYFTLFHAVSRLLFFRFSFRSSCSADTPCSWLGMWCCFPGLFEGAR